MTQLTASPAETSPALEVLPAARLGSTGGSTGGPPPEGPLVAPRGPSGPGRRAVLALGVGAAVVSSLLTAGVVTAVRGDGTTPAAASGGGGAAAVAQSGAQVPGLAGTATNWVTPAAKVGPSVVSVRVQAADGTGDEGSGVILDRLGRVLTNNHVVSAANGASILVVLSDGRAYSATVVGADPATDLAVLVMKSPPGTLQPATFADSSAVKVGDPVMAIGNPLGLSSTVTTGIVSALDRPVNTGSSTQSQSPSGSTGPQAEAVVTNAVQTDAAINPGNSGGALVDSAGRVIGITSSIASLGSSSSGQAGNIGIGFAIPANEATDVAHQLIATGTVKHAYLGVTLADGTVTVDGAGRSAAVVGTVGGGTPAAAGGLRAADSIIAVNGRTVDGADSLVAQIRAMHPGTSVALTVVRSGATTTLTVTLAARPAGS